MAPCSRAARSLLRFRAVLDANLAVGTRVTNTGTVYWNDPAQQASASASIDVGGIPGTGFVNGRVWHDADFDRVFDANEIALEGWTVELYLNDSLAYTARTSREGVYRLSGVEPNYATTDRLRAQVPSARRHRDDGDARPRAFRFHERSAADHGHRRAVGQQSAELESADRPERHRLRRSVAGTDRGGHRDASRRERRGAAVGLLLRREPAGAGHARGRLLQVRSELRRPSVPERRELPAAGDSAVRGVLAGCVRHHSAAVGRGNGRVRRAVVPGLDRRRRAGDGAALRGGAFGGPAAGVRRAAHERHELLPAPDVRLEPRAGLEPDLQQPHSARSRSRRVRDHHEDDADGERRARPARAVRDHGRERRRREPHRRHRRRSLPGGLPLRRRLGAPRRRAARARRRGPRARVDRSRR